MERPELSVVIVNYNTRRDLENCLESIYSGAPDSRFEVSVVDNDSRDGSADMVEARFPHVRLIRAGANLGFSRANNLALRESQGEFVLLLNPDTIVTPHAFHKVIAFLRRTPEAGMAGCRLQKADGTLDLACRRSFPSAFDGFCRASGLSRLFPKSRLFARYNLTYLPEDEVAEVEAVNGAFMLARREAVCDVGLLDEDYFMYMEDLDWCFRFRQKGWKIFYVPEAIVIHLKGQAGKSVSNRMIPEFFRSMTLFCRKHYLPRSSFPAYLLTLAGIKVWMYTTMVRNALRTEKRVTP